MKGIVVGMVVLVWSSAAAAQLPWQRERRLETSREGAKLLPLPKEEGVFHFAIYGDRTGGPPSGLAVLRQAVRDTNLLDPDLVMTVGDLIPGYTSTARWKQQARTYRVIMGGLKMPWYPVAGNHDVYWRGRGRPRHEHDANFEKHFGPLWYAFAHKNAAFVVLYSDEGDPRTGRKGFSRPERQQMSAKQLAWLTRTLRRYRRKDHVFVFLHHPRWIAARYPDNNWGTVHRALAAAGNVSAVFAGHIHRMHYGGVKDGIRYYTLATTGGGKRDDLPHEAGYLHHLNLVTVRKRRISVSAIPVGGVVDPRQFTPRRLREVDLLRALRPAIVGGPLEVAADGGVETAYRCGLSNPTSRPIEVTVSLRSDDAAWSFQPLHQHVRLAPRSSRLVSFGCRRKGAGFVRFGEVAVALDVHYLDERARISLPRCLRPLPMTLRQLPEGHFDAAVAGVLRLRRKACARVPSGAIRLPDGPFTLEAWLKPRRLGRRQALVAKTQNSGYALFVSGGRPSFSVHLGGRYVTAQGRPGDLRTGRWHHLAGVFDGRQVRLYLDGRRIARTAGSGRRTRNRFDLLIGADPDRAGRPVSHFDGLIDEVRLSRGARYDQAAFEPLRRHAPDQRTLLLLHLDRALGPFLPDHSGRAAHALLVGPARIEGQRRR